MGIKMSLVFFTADDTFDQALVGWKRTPRVAREVLAPFIP